MKILSLGWGVQSFTLAAMVALKELPMVDAVVHSDTTHESILTYRFAEKWTPWLEEHGVRVVTVKPKHSDPLDNGYGQEDPPFYSISKSGKAGQGKRQCTSQWKIYPMRRWIQANRKGQKVEQWIGISTDEYKRMRDSDVKYITNVYPLIDNGVSRSDCKKWLADHNLEEPPRSSCIFCPYHSTAEWRRIKQIPEDWKGALEVDEQMRNRRPPHRIFVHPSRRPLVDIDFRTPEEQGQLSLWDNECSGICGV